MAAHIVDILLGVLLLGGVIRLWTSVGRHSSREEVRELLGEALTLRSGKRPAQPNGETRQNRQRSGAGI